MRDFCEVAFAVAGLPIQCVFNICSYIHIYIYIYIFTSTPLSNVLFVHTCFILAALGKPALLIASQSLPLSVSVPVCIVVRSFIVIASNNAKINKTFFCISGVCTAGEGKGF